MAEDSTIRDILIAALIITTVCGMGIIAVLVVGLRGMIPAASAGLALAYASQLSGIMQYVVRLACETESRFTSVQRMHTHLKVNDSYSNSLPYCF